MDSSFFKHKIVLTQWAKRSARINLEQRYQAREQNLVLVWFICLDSSQSSWFISSGLVRMTKSLSVTIILYKLLTVPLLQNVSFFKSVPIWLLNYVSTLVRLQSYFLWEAFSDSLEPDWIPLLYSLIALCISTSLYLS